MSNKCFCLSVCLSVCLSRWLRFTHWAAREGFDPLNPSAAQIAVFLYSLFDTLGLWPQTVKGYRTCLGSVPN